MSLAPSTPDRWADLRTRVLSAIVLVAFAAFEIYEGGRIFNIAVCLLVGLMVWEVAVMTQGGEARGRNIVLGVLAALSLLAWDQLLTGPWRDAVLALPALGLVLVGRRDRRALGAYGLAVLLAGAGFLWLRSEGAGIFLWLVLIVVASDTLGYFAGRILGGPKFWPAISPKKTWSGTVAGWIGAFAVGLGYVLAGWPVVLLWLSPLVAFAGQMGDIAESALKRRAGIKDSSRLIPGHGGVLDRFDALIGAMLALLALQLLPIGVL